MIIAIDGPSASGKSTLAKLLGQCLGYQVIESGKYYRYITWVISNRNLHSLSSGAIVESLSNEAIEWAQIHESHMTSILRCDRISELVPTVAAIQEVRDIVNCELRETAHTSSAVVEGRDIGTVVFPDAHLKVYLDVPMDIRAARRKSEGSNECIITRDAVDTDRVIAPLKPAANSFILKIQDQSPQILWI